MFLSDVPLGSLVRFPTYYRLFVKISDSDSYNALELESGRLTTLSKYSNVVCCKFKLKIIKNCKMFFNKVKQGDYFTLVDPIGETPIISISTAEKRIRWDYNKPDVWVVEDDFLFNTEVFIVDLDILLYDND